MTKSKKSHNSAYDFDALADEDNLLPSGEPVSENLKQKKSPTEKSKAKKIKNKDQAALRAKEKKKANKKDAEKKSADKSLVPGSQRGVETMLRSAYRTNLEMTALADNKANMLISVNGLILSVMIATGGLSIFMKSDLLYVLPMVALAITSFIAMLFAILVARPRVDFSWRPQREDFDADRANPFLFMHFQNLDQDEYLDLSFDVMRDKERLYRHMVSHNYGMGVVLARKFKLLRLSYNVFMAGLGFTVLLFVAVNIIGSGGAEKTATQQTLKQATQYQAFSDIYEPSAAVPLADGRMMIFEDESERPVTILDLSPSANVSSQKLYLGDQTGEADRRELFGQVSDIEAAEKDGSGNIYVLTSHARRERDGKLSDGRSKFLRFRFDGDVIRDSSARLDLLGQLEKTYPLINAAARVRSAKSANGLNIEGLAIHPVDGSLLIGFRSPIGDTNGHAFIAVLKNPDAVFTQAAAMEFSARLIELDLDGGGIRGMTYSEKLGGFLIISGRANVNKVPFALWFWNGKPQQQAQRVLVKGVNDLARAEAILPMTIDGQELLFILSDDGQAESLQPAQYLMLTYEQLVILP